ncbi:hypothetical protein NMY22_g11937 [Coprinellus aureogranulatus]|nr:hypothetical protein NMY22_g11937 [Coprinellus aureogranulatus]
MNNASEHPAGRGTPHEGRGTPRFKYPSSLVGVSYERIRDRTPICTRSGTGNGECRKAQIASKFSMLRHAQDRFCPSARHGAHEEPDRRLQGRTAVFSLMDGGRGMRTSMLGVMVLLCAETFGHDLYSARRLITKTSSRRIHPVVVLVATSRPHGGSGVKISAEVRPEESSVGGMGWLFVSIDSFLAAKAYTVLSYSYPCLPRSRSRFLAFSSFMISCYYVIASSLYGASLVP